MSSCVYLCCLAAAAAGGVMAGQVVRVPGICCCSWLRSHTPGHQGQAGAQQRCAALTSGSGTAGGSLGDSKQRKTSPDHHSSMCFTLQLLVWCL
jgi:hypothetical protein